MNTRRRRIARHRRRLTSFGCPVHIPPFDRIWLLERYIIANFPRHNLYDWLMAQHPTQTDYDLWCDGYHPAGSITHCKISSLSKAEIERLFPCTPPAAVNPPRKSASNAASLDSGPSNSSSANPAAAP